MRAGRTRAARGRSASAIEAGFSGSAQSQSPSSQVFGERRDARHHHRRAAGQRLEHDQAEAFVERGHRDRVGQAVERRACRSSGSGAGEQHGRARSDREVAGLRAAP